VALLAGGLATRLGGLTRATPKSMVILAGEPFIAHQLRLLAGKGVTRVTIGLGHLGDQIADFVGDGARFGCQVTYSADGDQPLGSGGAVAKALPLLGEAFFVLYGDSYLPIALRPVWEAFRAQDRPGLMTVFRNDGRWDRSNVEFRDGAIRLYDKARPTAAMHHIDYGLGILTRRALAGRAAEQAWDLAALYGDLARDGELGAYEVRTRFYEIGSPSGLAQTADFLLTQT
jgi:NDP-sugar pyrophosphorylase family protein